MMRPKSCFRVLTFSPSAKNLSSKAYQLALPAQSKKSQSTI